MQKFNFWTLALIPLVIGVATCHLRVKRAGGYSDAPTVGVHLMEDVFVLNVAEAVVLRDMGRDERVQATGRRVISGWDSGIKSRPLTGSIDRSITHGLCLRKLHKHFFENGRSASAVCQCYVNVGDVALDSDCRRPIIDAELHPRHERRLGVKLRATDQNGALQIPSAFLIPADLEITYDDQTKRQIDQPQVRDARIAKRDFRPWLPFIIGCGSIGFSAYSAGARIIWLRLLTGPAFLIGWVIALFCYDIADKWN